MSLQIVEFAREHGRVTMRDAIKLTGEPLYPQAGFQVAGCARPRSPAGKKAWRQV